MADAYSANVVACVRFGSSGAVSTHGDKTGLFDWTGVGNAAQVPEGDSITGSYLNLDGNGDYLSTPGRPSFQIGAGVPFVIDFGIKISAFDAGDSILYYRTGSTGFCVDITGPVRLVRGYGNSLALSGSTSIADGVRKHVVFSI